MYTVLLSTIHTEYMALLTHVLSTCLFIHGDLRESLKIKIEKKDLDV